MLKGNKGEWSEIYAFFKLLSEQKLYVGDPNLNKIDDFYYPIIKILRTEGQNKFEYICNSNIQIVNGNTNEVLFSVPVSEFSEMTLNLFDKIKKANESSFSFPDIEEFMTQIKCTSLKAKSVDKSDIKIVIHDARTGLTPKLGFSIKSKLGKASTLFNAGKTTNFIFKIADYEIETETLNSINNNEQYPTIKNRLDAISEFQENIVFIDIEKPHLFSNLQVIDSLLPQILSDMLINYYKNKKNKVIDLLEDLNKQNPCKYNIKNGHPFYEYKIKNFLTDVALGMMPSKIWDGKYEATGGYLIIKKDGDILCYHIYNRNEFQEYLIKNTKFETADPKKHDFGYIYRENGKTYIKLNLQIRFI